MAPYQERSYAEVLRWMENTEIKYVPHGKKPGTKSYVRYERYSQAKTVAECLEFGSKPEDLLNDFEKGLLKRTGGPVREKPLNMLQVEDHSTLTKTDLSLARFAKFVKQDDADAGGEAASVDQKELARKQGEALRKARMCVKFGVKADELAQGTGWAETPEMVAMRSKANVEAARVLDLVAAEEGRKVTDADVLGVLRLWAVKQNRDRKMVMPEGSAWVHSETCGLLQCKGADLMATYHVKQYPKVMAVFARWMKDNRPEGQERDFPFTSITVNAAYAPKRHRDHLNLGPVVVKSLGDFQGGLHKYWEQDDKRGSVDELREEDAVTLDTHEKTLVFDGNRAHAVESYTGEERYSLVFYTTAAVERTSDEVRQQLLDVGFPLPNEEDLTYLKTLLPPPKGYSSYLEPKKGSSGGAKGLQKKKFGGVSGILMAKMMALRAAAAAQREQEEAARADGEEPAAAQGGESEQKKAPVLLSTSGMLARELAKRASEGTSGDGPKLLKKHVKVKTLSMGGLLGRIQQSKGLGVPSPAVASTPARAVSAPVVPSATKTQQGAAAAAQDAEAAPVEKAPAVSEAAVPANEAPAAMEESTASPPVRSSLVPTGLLARTLAKRQGLQLSTSQKAGPPAKVKKAGKPLVVGGLLARVQKRALGGGDDEEPTPKTPKEGTQQAEETTPASKRAKVDAIIPEPMALSGKKVGRPPKALQPTLNWQAATTSAEPKKAPVASVSDPTCDHFLPFAEICASTADDAAAGLATCLKKMAAGAGAKAPEVVRSAMALMVPVTPVPASVIAGAISEAFGVPCEANLLAEAMAAKALEARARKFSLSPAAPLTITEVASVAREGDSEGAVQRVAKVLASTQMGMEPFMVVRALQGKLAPQPDVLHVAVANAVTQ